MQVLEIAPPWVQTDLLNSNNEPRAMPLAPFIAQTIALFATDENVKRLAMYASFTSLVNQRSGRRHSQDPVSAAEHASAYEAIVSQGPGADQALGRWQVRFMALRRLQQVLRTARPAAR